MRDMSPPIPIMSMNLRSSDFDSLEFGFSLREPYLQMRGLTNLERVRSKFPYSLPRLFSDKYLASILAIYDLSIPRTRLAMTSKDRLSTGYNERTLFLS